MDIQHLARVLDVEKCPVSEIAAHKMGIRYPGSVHRRGGKKW